MQAPVGAERPIGEADCGQPAAGLPREVGLYTTHEMIESLDPNYPSEVGRALMEGCERMLDHGLAEQWLLDHVRSVPGAFRPPVIYTGSAGRNARTPRITPTTINAMPISAEAPGSEPRQRKA